MPLLESYSTSLKDLKAAVAEPGRKRPHKACMILAVIELIEAKKIREDVIRFDDVLISRYRAYFEIVRQGNDTLNPWLPFFHLRGDSFWHLKAKPGRDAVVEAMNSATKRSAIEDNIEYAYLDKELYSLLLNPLDRDVLRETMVLHWFPDSANQIFEHIGVTEFELSLEAGQSDSAQKSQVRSSAFRRLVVEAYDFRCAATGWRILMPDYSALVEAAHIIPFSETADDRPQNGIALTPTFHRALDKGMIAPGPDLKWHVSRQIDRVPDNAPLLELEGRDIRLPRDARYKPDQVSLEWRLQQLL